MSSPVQLLYLFSAECTQCEKTNVLVSVLSREFPVEGIWIGSKNPGPVGFPVRKSTPADKERYSITDEPSLVVLKNGKTSQTIRGECDILSSRTIIKGIEKGALTVSEAIEKGPQKTYTVVGWIESRGAYFEKARFVLTDRKRAIAVNPWLPLEAVKSPFKRSRPRLMSDVIGKPVFLEGLLTTINDDYRFTVRKELILE
jgi:hypothetical protein